METDLIEERPNGPALVGTRVYIDDILVYLFDPGTTEASLAATLGLSPEQVAAARAYILYNPDTVFARRMESEMKPIPENPPEFVERMRARHESLMRYKAWLTSQEAKERREAEQGGGDPMTFRQWLTEQESRRALFVEWLAASESRKAMFDEWMTASKLLAVRMSQGAALEGWVAAGISQGVAIEDWLAASKSPKAIGS